MSISPTPSKISLPQINPGCATVLDYLTVKFPLISRDIWRQRMNEGKVHTADGSLLRTESPYQAKLLVHYYREVSQEQNIPFKEQILFQNDEILVAYKPHFLPVTPGGRFVNECLQSRLRETTQIADLQALHRLDRATAGLVLLAKKPTNRALYHKLFSQRKIHKSYQAVSRIDAHTDYTGHHWQVKNRIIRSQPSFLMRISEGEANSHSEIQCVKQQGDKALFELQPITGKTHQLRLHMHSIGLPIIGDTNYPVLQPAQKDNFNQPLQLLAKTLSFIDPVSGEQHYFECQQQLAL